MRIPVPRIERIVNHKYIQHIFPKLSNFNTGGFGCPSKYYSGVGHSHCVQSTGTYTKNGGKELMFDQIGTAYDEMMA